MSATWTLWQYAVEQLEERAAFVHRSCFLHFNATEVFWHSGALQIGLLLLLLLFLHQQFRLRCLPWWPCGKISPAPASTCSVQPCVFLPAGTSTWYMKLHTNAANFIRIAQAVHPKNCPQFAAFGVPYPSFTDEGEIKRGRVGHLTPRQMSPSSVQRSCRSCWE